MTTSPEAAREGDQCLETESVIMISDQCLRETESIAYMHNPVQMLCLVSVYKGQCLCLRCDYVACDTCHFLYFLYSGAFLCYCICEGVSCICTVTRRSGASAGLEVQQAQRALW